MTVDMQTAAGTLPGLTLGEAFTDVDVEESPPDGCNVGMEGTSLITGSAPAIT
jgi:hypothetical protein